MHRIKRPAAEVTTEDLIATIHADRDDEATFEARAEFQKRCGSHDPMGSSWRDYAPINPRRWITCEDGGKLMWINFNETGEI